MQFLLALIFLFGSAGLDLGRRTQQGVSLHSWQESKSNDPANEPRRQFTLDGKFLPPLPGDAANPPALLLKCAPGQRSGGKGKFRVGAVVVGVPLKVHWVEPPERKAGISYYPEVSVSYRLDESKLIRDDWPPRYDKSSIEFEKSDFKKMLRAKTILITMVDQDDHQVAVQFDMPDSSEGPLTTAQVAEACGVPDLKK
jgi:hypothetical protein